MGPQRDMTEETENIRTRTEEYGEGESADTSWSPEKKECSSLVGSSLQLNQKPRVLQLIALSLKQTLIILSYMKRRYGIKLSE